MDFESQLLTKRTEILSDIADLYYNRGMTQSEIAKMYDTNRFRVARLIQDARNEKIVEIHINSNSERNLALETELEGFLGLQKAIVVNTRNNSYSTGLGNIGKVGARYLNSLIEDDAVIGTCWGKTIHSVVSQMEGSTRGNIRSLQVCGRFRSRDPIFSSREMARMIALNYNGRAEYIYLPLYLRNPEMVPILKDEPLVRKNFELAKEMNILITGIGGASSLPTRNSQFEEYLTEKDRKQEEKLLGSFCGYALDKNGEVADLDLNRKLVACEWDILMLVPHRVVVGCGRHKKEILLQAGKKGVYNELITDVDTARCLLEERSVNDRNQ